MPSSPEVSSTGEALLPAHDPDDVYIGSTYALIGLLGLGVNALTMMMIVCKRVFRLSAYVLMANIALADGLLLAAAGIACGWSYVEGAAPLLARGSNHTSSVFSSTPSSFSLRSSETARYVLSAVQIASWTAGVASYTLLGLNRCIAICYYGTRARAWNQMPVAVAGSLATWTLGLAAAIGGTFPSALIGIHPAMYTMTVIAPVSDKRTRCFIFVLASLNVAALLGQWCCSLLVLLKIRYVKQKISRNKLNQNSANRFRKQARLTFQFFYPSLLCTLSSMLLFAKPLLFHAGVLHKWPLVLLHVVWLCNHSCNPFIYAYFNDRMRITYKQMLTCATLRYEITKRRVSQTFTQSRHMSRRSNGISARPTRMSVRSLRGVAGAASARRDANFVRSSLQLQSRDFEQLCEFMMRVNPFYDSSEGWRESSDEDDNIDDVIMPSAPATRRLATSMPPAPLQQPPFGFCRQYRGGRGGRAAHTAF